LTNAWYHINNQNIIQTEDVLECSQLSPTTTFNSNKIVKLHTKIIAYHIVLVTQIATTNL